MKRARIKATVTVPTRRKTTQENVKTEPASATDSIERLNNEVNDTPSILKQQFPEDNVQEIQVEDVPIETEQIKIETIHESVSIKSETKRNFDELGKGIPQPLENTNTQELGSPTKLSQSRLSFMRPVPKLDSGARIRRNSIQGSGASASESEDDCRRTNPTTGNHAKNDLVNAADATMDTVVNSIKTTSLTKSKMGQKRRALVSESAKKLADARREFNLKHENKIPDRSKLTMYDLIHYNPVTNPMKKSKDSETVARKLSICQLDELQEEEDNVDDPLSAMPVPQVKVGPDGQLIIDEQSLVIEQTNAKKNREMLAKEAIIDDDTGGGFYKKRHKSKEWPKWETLKFYKALNTVGTDFLLMQTLFPKRTRQEIKVKFKKEEKINRNLIEKALKYHQEFDTELLEKSFALMEKSEKEVFVRENKSFRKRKLAKSFKRTDTKRRCRIVATSIGEMDEISDEDEDSDPKVQNESLESNEDEQSLKKTHKKKRRKGKDEKKTSEVPSTETEDIEESLSVCSGIDSDTEIYHVRPTRSGRLPKVKKLQGPDINTLDNERSNCDSSDQECTTSPKNTTKDVDNVEFENANNNPEINYANSVKTAIPNIDNVEPGSLLILSKNSPGEPGKSVLQVYMISSNVNSSENIEEPIVTPTNLPPELLATVTTRLSNAESIPVKEEYE
ncbi:transcription factor TFIIIB component B'' homolog Bdp1 [Augochlora pura]